MMKKIRIFILLLLISILGGCTSLQTPTIISYENHILTWTAINGASGYELTINETIHHISDVTYNFFDFSDFEEGSYTVKIKSVKTVFGKDQTSAFSEPYEVVVVSKYQAPTDLHQEGGNLIWDYSLLVTGFVVSINGEEQIIDDDYFDLQTLSSDNVYAIKVKALFPSAKESPYSSLFIYHTYQDLSDEINYSFLKSSNTNLVIDLDEAWVINRIATKDNQTLDDSVYNLDEYLVIDDLFLKTLDYGPFVLFLHTTLGTVLILIEITDDRRPYLISQSEIGYVECQDIQLEFNLFDGEVVSITGNDISKEDYIIVGSKVIISGPFVSSKFRADESLHFLIFHYRLRSTVYDEVGYIIITK